VSLFARFCRSHGVFYPSGPILETTRKLLGQQSTPATLNETQRRAILQKFRNVLFHVTHHGDVRGRYRFSGLSKHDANTQMFTDASGLTITIADYFATHYASNAATSHF